MFVPGAMMVFPPLFRRQTGQMCKCVCSITIPNSCVVSLCPVASRESRSFWSTRRGGVVLMKCLYAKTCKHDMLQSSRLVL
jgi:hypothetical protein